MTAKKAIAKAKNNMPSSSRISHQFNGPDGGEAGTIICRVKVAVCGPGGEVGAEPVTVNGYVAFIAEESAHMPSTEPTDPPGAGLIGSGMNLTWVTCCGIGDNVRFTGALKLPKD